MKMPPAREEVQVSYPARPLAGKTPPSRPPPSLPGGSPAAREAAALLAQAGNRLPSVLLLNPSGAARGSAPQLTRSLRARLRAALVRGRI